MYFLENLLYFGAWIRQTKCVRMMSKEGCTKIVNFMTAGARVLVLGRGHISHLETYILSIYSTLIAIVLIMGL